MSLAFELPLPRFDRILLRLVQTLVPAGDREDWSRTWQAELGYLHQRFKRIPSSTLSSWKNFRLHADLSCGLVLDALWLRTEDWRRTYSGTPLLCLVSLVSLCVFSLAVSFSLQGSWHEFARHLAAPLKACFLATPLVVFVAYATAAPSKMVSSTEGNVLQRLLYRLQRQLFFVGKTALLLTLAFLASTNLCHPLCAVLPNTAYLLQILCFNITALLGMRWAFLDQEQRCKQCLRSLSTPARVGRPSCNLLEWTGMEQTCAQGHGRLHVPEMHSSWAQSSSWNVTGGTWDEASAGWDEIASA